MLFRSGGGRMSKGRSATELCSLRRFRLAHIGAYCITRRYAAAYPGSDSRRRWFAPEDIKPLDRSTKVPTGLTAGDQDLYEKGLAIANNKKKLKSWFAKPTRLERELKRVFDAEAEEALGGRAYVIYLC